MRIATFTLFLALLIPTTAFADPPQKGSVGVSLIDPEYERQIVCYTSTPITEMANAKDFEQTFYKFASMFYAAGTPLCTPRLVTSANVLEVEDLPAIRLDDIYFKAWKVTFELPHAVGQKYYMLFLERMVGIKGA